MGFLIIGMDIYSSIKFKIMRLSKLNLKLSAIAAVMGAGFFLTACNESTESEKTSTTEADTASANINAPVTTTVTDSAGTTAKKPRSGKISVAANKEDRSSAMKADNTGYYNYAEVSPSYNGGQSAIENYINNNIVYPQDAIDNNMEGTVQVQFGIDDKGNVSNVKTVGNKLGYGLEEEAMRVVKSMPKWTPGTVKGKAAKVWVTLPITFRIES
jgi:periplasmic protein TonB